MGTNKCVATSVTSKWFLLNKYFTSSTDTGCHSIVSTLLAHGANAARCDDDGNTALHRAAGGGHRDAWSVLCAHDSTLLTMANRRQQTALDLVPSDRRDEFEEDVRTSFANQI